jgi:hypothetical protein
MITKPLDVEDRDIMASAKQFWHQHAAFVSAATGNENFHVIFRHK